MQKLSAPSWNSGQVLGTAGAIPSDWICLRLPDLQGWSLVSSHGSGRGSQCPPLEPKVVVATLSLPQSSCRQCLVSCISGGSRLLPIHSQLSRPDLSTLLLHLTLVLSLGLSFGSQTQHSTLTLTNRVVSQVGKCMAEVPTLWAGYSPSCLPQTCCCSPFLSSQTPPPSNTISLLVRRLPKVWETFLLHNSFPSVLVPS